MDKRSDRNEILTTHIRFQIVILTFHTFRQLFISSHKEDEEEFYILPVNKWNHLSSPVGGYSKGSACITRITKNQVVYRLLILQTVPYITKRETELYSPLTSYCRRE
ncbi:hypothetical protein AVEN_23237-1 [Araneus ventricosus]|uniref:Uncharacterized protein n=1 Tax=Araneus ventricosus TaxID=182803 RepID=A0A4Y2PI16_ARAVE|nr:hypothetical protein AVEN_23237-1 [Araneus ventricosus]